MMVDPYKNIRTAVFLSQYGLLLFGGVIAIIVVAGIWPAFNFYPILGLMFGVVLRTLFIQTRYVAGFEIREEELQIKYITSFFTERTYQKALNEISDINLEETGELNIVTIGKCETFDLAKKKIKRDIEAKVNSANIASKKQG
ncbi:hypothetical protein [Flavisolibacter ginsengisoli]|jgi:hypothetical protein|uniref:PH domain-containing protein n=1 Tax=Flavisolibacter ginsengisoli DSM 18119 TaxID=1121884 RepID=A0A1M4XYJ4_9BACT|nr:hypothetical protein [Flavisolibacter ginsengisoli]SHE98383.1 hypothetical protein SAMN02745131_01526 [Flavisolibacter ginsengisoli DSM 18119]